MTQTARPDQVGFVNKNWALEIDTSAFANNTKKNQAIINITKQVLTTVGLFIRIFLLGKGKDTFPVPGHKTIKKSNVTLIGITQFINKAN